MAVTLTDDRGTRVTATTRQSIHTPVARPFALADVGKVPHLNPPYYVVAGDGHGTRWKIVTGMTDHEVAAALRSAADDLDGRSGVE